MVQLSPWVSVPSTNSYRVASSSQVLCRVHRHSWEPAGHAVPGPVEFTVGQGFVPGGSAVWNLPAGQEDAGDVGSIPGWGRSPGGGHSSPFQYSCWDNPMDRGTWWAIVHGVTRSWSDATDAAKHEQALGFVNSVITIFLFSAWLHLLRPYYLCEGFYGDKH